MANVFFIFAGSKYYNSRYHQKIHNPDCGHHYNMMQELLNSDYIHLIILFQVLSTNGTNQSKFIDTLENMDVQLSRWIIFYISHWGFVYQLQNLFSPIFGSITYNCIYSNSVKQRKHYTSTTSNFQFKLDIRISLRNSSLHIKFWALCTLLVESRITSALIHQLYCEAVNLHIGCSTLITLHSWQINFSSVLNIPFWSTGVSKDLFTLIYILNMI